MTMEDVLDDLVLTMNKLVLENKDIADEPFMVQIIEARDKLNSAVITLNESREDVDEE